MVERAGHVIKSSVPRPDVDVQTAAAQTLLETPCTMPARAEPCATCAQAIPLHMRFSGQCGSSSTNFAKGELTVHIRAKAYGCKKKRTSST